jgi:glycosyltransferase involved in cell wall biosynthesis
MEKKIHIWCPNFKTFGGGIGTFTKELVYSLKKNKASSISVISKNDINLNFKSIKFILILKILDLIKLILFILKIFYKTITDKPDLIIITHINFVLIANSIKILFKIPYILTAHGIEIKSKPSKFKLLSINNSEKILVVSRWTQNKLFKLGIKKNKISIIGNTASEKIFKINNFKKKLRDNYKIHSSDKIILTVARLEKNEQYKGYDKIIKAIPKIIKKFNNIRYLIVGDGNDRERIEILINKLKINKHVKLCGFISDKELPAYYCMADIFALPSTGEGFGIVFIESMLSGTPVIAGNKDGSVDAIQNGYLGKLVNPHKITSITQGIIDLLKKKGPKFWFSPKKLRKACLFFHSTKIFSEKINYEIDNIKFKKI